MNFLRVFVIVTPMLLCGCKPLFPTDAEIAEQCQVHVKSRGGNAAAVSRCIDTTQQHRDLQMAKWAAKFLRY